MSPILSISLLPTAKTSQAFRYETDAQAWLDSLAPPSGYVYGPGDDVSCQVRGSKDGPCWSPITWDEDQRDGAGAESISCLVFDLDWDEQRHLYEHLEQRLQATGWKFAIHETYTAGRGRLVLPLAAPVSPADYLRVWSCGAVALGARGAPLQADTRAGPDLGRVSYLPSTPGPARVCEQGGEVWATAEAVLAEASAVSGLSDGGWAQVCRRQPTSQAEGNVEVRGGQILKNFDTSSEPIDLQSIRLQLSKAGGELRSQLLGVVDFTLRLRKGARENDLHRLTSAFVSQVKESRGPDGWRITEALFRPLVERMEEVEDQGVNYYVEKVHSSWVRAVEYAENVEAQRAKTAEVFEKLRAGKVETAEEGRVEASGGAWQDRLVYNMNADGSVRSVRPISSNIDLILENDPAFKGHIRYNELLRRMEVSGGALRGYDSSYDVALMQWLERSAYRIEARKEMCGSTLLHHSRRFRYDPVSEYLNALAWDGTRRIHRVLLDICSAMGNEKYLEDISRKFFISAVARALEPGSKVDTVLTLQGRQGARKTSFVETLSCGWYTTSTGKTDDKDMRVQTTESWLVELGELASMRRSSIESLRSFISLRHDRIRIPYATYHEEFPRRCVFVGTTNAAQPLTDEEGNRRWWVVTCGSIDIPRLERERDQLWAEAVHLFREWQQKERHLPERQQKNRWWFTFEEQKISDEENEMFTVENTVLLDLQMWMAAIYEKGEAMPPVTLNDAARRILKVPTETIHRDTSLLPRLQKAMTLLGWRRLVRSRNGGRYNVYQMPTEQDFKRAVEQEA